MHFSINYMCPLRLFGDHKAYLNAFPINAVCPLITWQGMFVNALFNQFQVPFAHMAGHIFECTLLFNQFKVPLANITRHISEFAFQSIPCALCSHYRAYFNQFHVTLLILQGIFLNALFSLFHVTLLTLQGIFQSMSCDFAHIAGHISINFMCPLLTLQGNVFECTLLFNQFQVPFAHITGHISINFM